MDVGLLLSAAKESTVLLRAENLPAAGHQPYDIRVRVVLGQSPNVCFDAPYLEEACLGIVFVDQDYLAPVHLHPVASDRKYEQVGLVWAFLESFGYACSHFEDLIVSRSEIQQISVISAHVCNSVFYNGFLDFVDVLFTFRQVLDPLLDLDLSKPE